MLALIFVPPLTDFSKDPDIPAGRWRDMSFKIESALQNRLQLGPGRGAGEMGEPILCAIVKAPAMGSSCSYGGALGVPPVRSAQAARVECDT